MTGDQLQRPSLAHKIDRLFRTLQPAGRGEYTYQEVADAVRAAGGPTISATYVWQLRRGLRDNPTRKHLEALAGFFGVPASYFFDDDVTRIDGELDLLAALRDQGVRHLALRSAGLSSDSLSVLAEMVERVRQLEGLRENEDDEHGGDAWPGAQEGEDGHG